MEDKGKAHTEISYILWTSMLFFCLLRLNIAFTKYSIIVLVICHWSIKLLLFDVVHKESQITGAVIFLWVVEANNYLLDCLNLFMILMVWVTLMLSVVYSLCGKQLFVWYSSNGFKFKFVYLTHVSWAHFHGPGHYSRYCSFFYYCCLSKKKGGGGEQKKAGKEGRKKKRKKYIVKIPGGDKTQ